jgi:TfoX/Sxy family transcriptional regulator of competence genes
MSNDGALADRLRRALADPGLTEKRMFGGVCFMRHDHMLCGISKRGFLFRVGREQEPAALARPGTSVMEMNGRHMHGYVRVDPARCSDADLADLVAWANRFVATLPPKKAR